jgi:hypothetical protein
MHCAAFRKAQSARSSPLDEEQTPLRHLRRYGCFLKREGRAHSLGCSPRTGQVEAVPRHTGIPDRLARKIRRSLSLPEV